MPTTRNLSLAGLLNDSMARWLSEHVYTALPGKVERFDAAIGCVDVQPCTMEPDELEDGTTVVAPLQVLPNVPLMQIGGGSFRTTYPISVGDYVLVIFARRSIDKWKSFGGVVDPADSRMFNLSDAVAIPGLLPFNAPWTGVSTSAMTAGKDDGPQIHFGATDIKLGGGDATQSALHAESFKSALDTMIVAIQTYVSAAALPSPGAAAALNAFNLAVTVFGAAYTAAKSTLVKVK